MASKAEVKAQLVNQLTTLLPTKLKVEKTQVDHSFSGITFDFVTHVNARGMRKILLGKVESLGQPRFLRQAITELQESGVANDQTYFIIAAPYLSRRGLEICQHHRIGCVDLAGNCYLEFDGVYIERIVSRANPEPARRSIKNLFTPIASRIIRALLEEPGRVWKLTELAQATGASIGQTHNVAGKLNRTGFTHKNGRGPLTLTDPGGLLDTWRREYDIAGLNQIHSFHTPEADPAQLAARIEEIAGRLEARYAFTFQAGVSLRYPGLIKETEKVSSQGDVHFYIEANPKNWADALGMQTVEFGGNVHLLQPYDEGVFYRSRTAQGLVVAGKIQLYLDLFSDQVRGREQARRLREQKIGF